MTLADLHSKTGNAGGALDESRQAIAILEKLSAAAPTNLFMRGQLAEALVATGAVLTHQGHAAEARARVTRGVTLARDLAQLPTATPDDLSRYALILLTCEPAELRDPAIALENAKRAVDESGGHDPRSLHILAKAYLESGDAARAAETERPAQSPALSAQK